MTVADKVRRCRLKPLGVVWLLFLTAGCKLTQNAPMSSGPLSSTPPSPKESTQESIKLPKPLLESNVSLEETLNKRRSVREYRDEPLSLQELSQLFWAVQGETDPRGLRTAPSAGALYPLEVYAVVSNVQDLSRGVYKYRSKGHELVKLAEGNHHAELTNHVGADFLSDSGVIFIFGAVYERTTQKYGERGIRYVHLETGHAAQNVYLQVQSLGLGTVVIGAFDDDEVQKITGMERDEKPLYLMPVGKV